MRRTTARCGHRTPRPCTAMPGVQQRPQRSSHSPSRRRRRIRRAQAMQGSAVTQANSASTGTGVQSQLQQVISSVPSSLNQLTLAGVRGDECGRSPGFLGQLLDFLDGADGNSIGTFLNSSLVNGVVSGSYVSPALITPAITSGIGRHQLVGSGRRVGGTWGRRRYRHDHSRGRRRACRAWAFR